MQIDPKIGIQVSALAIQGYWPAMSERQKIITLLLIDRYALLRDSLGRLLSTESDFTIAAQCASIQEALDVVKQEPVDVVLLDFYSGETEAGEFIQAARRKGFKGKVLLLALQINEDDATNLIRAGICGIFQKRDSAASLGHAIRDVAAGNLWFRQEHLQNALVRRTEPPGQSNHELTTRETRVLALICDGLKNREIGAQIGVSEGSVKATLQQLFFKFGVRSRSQLVRIALQQSRHSR